MIFYAKFLQIFGAKKMSIVSEVKKTTHSDKKYVFVLTLVIIGIQNNIRENLQFSKTGYFHDFSMCHCIYSHGRIVYENMQN